MKKTRGQQFRVSVEAAVEDMSDAGPAWLGILDETCRALDLLEELEERVRSDGMMLDGLHQKVLNPAVREVRQQRVALARLLGRLGLDEAGGTLSDRQRRAANARWGK